MRFCCRRLFALACAFTLMVSCASAQEAPLPCSDVTYEIFVASFQDADGDGIGDLQGILQRLDYIAALGASRIWLMPIHPSPSYHKYDVTDYYAVDPAYGTLADFDALVAACAARGIDVMLDLVINHTSKEHPWFLEACEALQAGVDSPYLNWYHFSQGSGQHQLAGSNWFYEGQFGDHMPDLNLDEPAVRAELARIIGFWQAHGVKGFRLDAVTSYYTGASKSNADFLRFLTETAKANDPDCYLVAEAWTDSVSILALYESGIDSLFNFPAADATGWLLTSALNGTGAAATAALANWNAQLRAVSPNSVDAPFLTNHDMSRARGVLRSDVNRQKVAAMLYLLLPGVPTVYYGEELGMSGSGRDENKRLPMVWSVTDTSAQCLPPANADQAQRLKEGVDIQEADPDSLLNCYRQLIALRRLAPELRRGAMTALDGGHDAIAYYRVDDGDSAVAVVVNTSTAETISVDLSGLFSARVLGQVGGVETTGTWLSPLANLDFSYTVVMPPVSCLVLRVE